jgi:galactonate dehydratase
VLPLVAAAEVHGRNVAVHNCYSPLATLMGAAFCASVPNLQMLELDVDGVPWQNDFLTCAPMVRDGYVELPSGPGWGTEIDEAAVRAHPVSRA